MILPIIGFGDSVLRQKCSPIDKDYPNLSVLIDNMWQTMYKSEGVGLAAPQVGLKIRLFIVDTVPFANRRKKDFKGIKKVFINAEIIEQNGDLWGYEEGCLSIPGIRETVMRKPTISIKYFDENFTEHTDTFDDINARVIQHEYDHIEGILFIDHLSTLKKKLIQPKLLKIQKGQVDVEYKMKFATK